MCVNMCVCVCNQTWHQRDRSPNKKLTSPHQSVPTQHPGLNHMLREQEVKKQKSTEKGSIEERRLDWD